MKTYLTWGAILSGAGFVLAVVLYALGLHSDVEKIDTALTIQKWGGFAICIVCIVLGIKARRAAISPEEDFGYGAALGAGVMIALLAAVFGVVTNLLYTQLINPDFNELMIRSMVARREAAGVSGVQLEQMESMMRKFSSPPIQAAFGFVFGFVIGVLVSLVAAAFLKRPPADELQRA